MKQLLFCISLLLLCLTSLGQSLVHNYSFEQNTNCPIDTGQIAFANEWFSVGAGVDFYDSCCNNCSVDVPLNAKGYHLAYPVGHAYAGICLYKEYSPNFRGYIGATLDPLIPGHWYRVRMHLSGSSQVRYECNCPDMFFYIDQTIPQTSQLLPFTPQIDNNFQIGNDTVVWMTPNNLFYADSAYTKVLIGNFHDDAHSSISNNVLHAPNTPEAHSAYTYIDEVIIIDVTAAYLAGLETEQQTVTAYPNPFTEHITLSFANPRAQPHTLTVYNMQGIAVREINNITTGQVLLQREGLPAGYYFYHLSGTAGTMATGKLLIQ